MNDIDLSGISNWTPIGKTKSAPFEGKLDGQGHKITGLKISVSINSGSLNSPAHAAGLFGVCKGAMIKNLELVDVNVKVTNSSGYVYENSKIKGTNIYAGGISGYLCGFASVYNCHVSGEVTAITTQEAEDAYAGGIAGHMENSVVSYSENSASVKASTANIVNAVNAYAGGAAGELAGYGYIEHFSNHGIISAATKDYGNAYCGGILGLGSGVAGKTEITDSYNDGDVSATAGNVFCDNSYAGGIAGKYLNTIERVYNSGSVQSKATSILDGVAYGGGICAITTASTVIRNSASISKNLTATGTTKAYKYYIAYGNAVKENTIASSSLSGGVDDSSSAVNDNQFKELGFYKNVLLWDFNFSWEMTSETVYPKLKAIDTEDEIYQEEYIGQHKDFIAGSEYENILEQYRWAKIYWSEENNFASNTAWALYDGIDTLVTIASGGLKELLDIDNPYQAILADYISDRAVETKIIEMYEIEVPFKMEKIYKKMKAFIKENWEDGWGKLSDEDLFYLFHYQEKTSEEWINENFQDHLEEIVSKTRNSGKGFEKVVGVSSKVIDELLKLKDQYNDYASFINDVLKYSAHVESYCSVNERFKKILKRMEENIKASDAENKLMLKAALHSYTIYNDNEHTMETMVLQYMKKQCIAKIKSEFKDVIGEVVDGWINAVLSEAALSKLKAIGWSAKAGWQISEYITKNGELEDCRNTLRANASFESVMYDTLKEMESEFLADSTYDNACMFDAAFRFFKETQIYSMNTCMYYFDTYQTAWVTAIKTVSTTSMSSAIEQILYKKLFLYKTYCHGKAYDLGVKIIKVACPTNVYVYNDEGTEIASVINEEVNTLGTEIAVFVSGKEKWIAFPEDEDYSIRIIAADDGKMEYSVSEYQDDQKISTVVFPDISLTKDMVFNGKIKAGTNELSSYQLTDDSGNVYADYKKITQDNYIKMDDLVISSNNISLKTGESNKVDVEILPAAASYTHLTWYSSDEKVATVSEEGIIHGVGEGSCTITVCSIEENIAKTVNIMVYEKSADVAEPGTPESPIPAVTKEPDTVQEQEKEAGETTSPDTTSAPNGINNPVVNTTPVPGVAASTGAGQSVSQSPDSTQQPSAVPAPASTGTGMADDNGNSSGTNPAGASTGTSGLETTEESTDTSVTDAEEKGTDTSGKESEATSATDSEEHTGDASHILLARKNIRKAGKLNYMILSSGKKNRKAAVYNLAKQNVKNLTIPKKVRLDGKTYKVTSIYQNAFKGSKKLKSVAAGTNLSKIGKNAFKNCKSLEFVFLPKKLTSIGKNAFAGCSALRYLVIQSTTLRTVGKQAFFHTFSGMTVKTPKKVWKKHAQLLQKNGNLSPKAVFVVNPVKITYKGKRY